VSATPEAVGALRAERVAPVAAARPIAIPVRAQAPALLRRFAGRLGREWLPRVAWTIDRTGRTGVVGIALLLAAGLFLFSTHREVAAEVLALRAALASAQGQARTVPANEVAGPASALRPLPLRTDMPATLRQLFGEATKARLAIDTGRYEVSETRGSRVVRYRIALPVTGPYPQIRAFIDATLAKMPALALSELALERRSISDGDVEAQIRLTVYTAASSQGSPPAIAAAAATDRVVAPTHATALFAQHSWTVLPPQPRLPPPPPPPPPPDPTAPPFPYAYVGSFAPEGEPSVFFLTRGDHVVDARVGDRLDGVYQLESAASGQLVFVYLPLNIRQNIVTGVTR